VTDAGGVAIVVGYTVGVVAAIAWAARRHYRNDDDEDQA
jgi:hypothetical protein